jgi:nicotinamidase/pyrazinamidase
MLFIIDVQNSYVNSSSESYVDSSENMIPRIIEKISEYEEKEDIIIYTTDIYAEAANSDGEKADNSNDLSDVEMKICLATPEEKWGFSLPDRLKDSLELHENIKKSYYAIPPEKLVELQKRFSDKDKKIKEIEFIGVETHVCVLANAICVQSAFPDSEIIIDAALCRSNDIESEKAALKIMESLGMKVRR